MKKQTNRLLALPQRPLPLPNLLQPPPDWESLLGLQVKYLPLSFSVSLLNLSTLIPFCSVRRVFDLELLIL